MSVDQGTKLQQRTQSDSGSWLVSERRALRRVEHPQGNGDLELTFDSDDHARLGLSTKSANNFDVVIKEGVVAITDATVLRVMSSVLMS